MQFRNVIGQDEIKKRLIRSTKENRVSHTQLWLGDPGYGVLPLALAYIQYLFCENPTETDSCGRCSSCLKVEKLQHPDLHFSFPTVLAEAKTSDVLYAEWRSMIQENPYFNLKDWIERIDEKGRKPVIGTDESQNILKKLSLKSFEGGYKIMLIWMAEEMNPTCANKLLKILEEPPEKSLFFLISQSTEQLLPTIISRTQLLRIPQIDHTSLAAALIDNFELHLTEADAMAHFSMGNWAQAKNLVLQGSLNNLLRELFIDAFRAAYKKDVIAMMNWANQIAGLGKEEQKSFLHYALHMFRQSILYNYTGERLIRLSDEEKKFVANFSKFITGNNLEDLYRSFSEAHYSIERNANQKILFTDLVFQAMKLIHAH
jgi:DNA polymerase-3 subunit delta'